MITVRHGEHGGLHGLRQRLESDPELLALGPSAVLHAIMDRVVDDYLRRGRRSCRPTSTRSRPRCSAGRTDRRDAERIYVLKREVLELRRAVAPLAGAAAHAGRAPDAAGRRRRSASTSATSRTTSPGSSSRSASFDELLTTIVQANLAQVTVVQNEDMRKISAWVAIPPSRPMVAGIYGMNFTHMPELSWTYGYPVVVVPSSRSAPC